MSNYKIKLSGKDKINIPLDTIFTARVCGKGFLHLIKDREVVPGGNIILDHKEYKNATKPKRSRKSRQDHLEEENKRLKERVNDLENNFEVKVREVIKDVQDGWTPYIDASTSEVENKVIQCVLQDVQSQGPIYKTIVKAL